MKGVATFFVLVLTVFAATGSGSDATARRWPPRLTYVEAGAICLAGASPSRDVRLTRRRENFGPTWSPNGRRLAFGNGGSLYVQDARGHGRRISDATRTGYQIANPAWSPGGRRIAFAAFDGAQWLIHTIRPDGTGDQTVTYGGADLNPAWSPDGKTIAFERVDLVRRGTAIYITDAAGPRLTLLVKNGEDPSWSPDGRSIDFMRPTDDGYYHLFVVGADGTGLRQLTTGTGHDAQPAWSQDGQWIAFTRYLWTGGQMNEDIAVVRPDGADMHVVRHSTGDPGATFPSSEPAWRPAAPPRPGKGPCN